MKMNNEFDVIRKVKQDLRQMGFPIVRDKVLYKSNPRRIADIIAYTINEEGTMIPEVVVEIKAKPILGMQNQLQEIVCGLGGKYALLVVGTEYYWYNSETFLPIEPPKKVVTYGNYLSNKEDILETTANVLRAMQREIPTTYEQTWVLGYSLIIRLYLHKAGTIEQWRELSDREKYLYTLEEALTHLKLNHFSLNEILIRNLNGDILTVLIDLLDELPPGNPIMGEVFLNIVSNDMISNRDHGQYVAPPKVRELIRLVVGSINVDNGDVIDLTTGVGAILFDVTGIVNAGSVKGLEINTEMANLASIVMTLARRENIEIVIQDALKFDSDESTYKLVICDPPFGGRITITKNDDFSNFRVTKGGRRSSVDVSDLLIEKAIRLAAPGGNIMVLVTEGTLFRSPSTTRDLIRDETYIEGIISLPAHTYKPYSAVKTSLLILRKKKVGEPVPENLFLGSPQSLDEIDEVGNSFVEWKKGVLSK